MAHKEEIERKFLVQRERLPPLPEGARLVQGYLSFWPTVRVRSEEGPGNHTCGYLTVKGPGLVGRDEFEYEIPFEDARAMQQLAQAALVSKTRHRVPATPGDDLTWEIDVFDGANEGLIVAEIEIPSLECMFDRPAWLGQDVTEDPAYKNAALAQHPYNSWNK